MQSQWEALFECQLKAYKIPYVKEFRFHDERRWRCDFALIEDKILIEIEGGIWKNGRHTRGGGFENDCEKYNEAVIRNYKILRFTPKHVKTGKAIECLLTLQLQTASN